MQNIMAAQFKDLKQDLASRINDMEDNNNKRKCDVGETPHHSDSVELQHADGNEFDEHMVS